MLCLRPLFVLALVLGGLPAIAQEGSARDAASYGTEAWLADPTLTTPPGLTPAESDRGLLAPQARSSVDADLWPVVREATDVLVA